MLSSKIGKTANQARFVRKNIGAVDSTESRKVMHSFLTHSPLSGKCHVCPLKLRSSKDELISVLCGGQGAN